MLAEYFTPIVSLVIIQILGLVSPGPNFAITVRNSLLYSRRTGIITALGISFGDMIQVMIVVLGLGLVILETKWLYEFIRFGGAFYLIYLGICSFRAKNKFQHDIGNLKPTKDISAMKALRSGFTVNMLNPTVLVYFLSIFTAFLSPTAPTELLWLYIAIISGSTLIWYCGLAYCLSHQNFRRHFNELSHWIEFIAGAIFITLGARILLETSGLM